MNNEKKAPVRQIKFRGMTIAGEWVFGNYTVLHKDYSTVRKGHYISNKGGAPFAYMVRPETVGQLHNELSKKAGQEVYVGDKISFRLAEGLGFPESDDREGIVNTIEDHYGYYKNVKVIGSIHEGKETNS